VGERVKDKKATIARDAITGLVQVYRAWTYDTDEEEGEQEEKKNDDDDDDDDMHAEMARLEKRREDPTWKKKLSWIPGTLYMCLSRKEDVVRDRVFQLSDDILFPRASTVLTRTASLVQVYESLSDSESRGFEMMFKKRAHLQKRLKKYLESRNHKEAVAGNDVEVLSILRSIASIAAEQMNRKLQQKVTKELHTQKNKRIFKLLELFVNPSTSIETLRKSRTSLLSAVGSKSELADFLRFLLRKITLLTLNANNVTYLFQVIENKAASSLLHKISMYVPEMFDVAMSSLETHLCGRIEAFVQGNDDNETDTSLLLTDTLKLICRLNLKHISTSKKQIHRSAQSSLREMRQYLLNICTGSTNEFSGRKKRVQDFTSTLLYFSQLIL